METGDKEEILEAIGVFAEHIDQRFELIDRRFEGVDRRFESIDRRFEKIESTMATKADIANLTDTLDWLVGHAKKHDQEFLMLAHGLKRVSDDVDKIKPLVGLA